jgi:hypothetical protein
MAYWVRNTSYKMAQYSSVIIFKINNSKFNLITIGLREMQSGFRRRPGIVGSFSPVSISWK